MRADIIGTGNFDYLLTILCVGKLLCTNVFVYKNFMKVMSKEFFDVHVHTSLFKDDDISNNRKWGDQIMLLRHRG